METLDGLVESAGYETVFTPAEDFAVGRSVFRTYSHLSLTDTVVVAFMRRRDLKLLYSFDAGFEAIDGVTRVASPHHPFEPD